MMFIVAVLMLAFLIFVHELGHFIIARICGVKVEVFSIGFGKKLCFFKLFGTQFALSLIPLGGYVKLKGMDKEEKEENEINQANDSYAQKSPFQKLWILFGGAFFNFLFAILVYFFLALSGEKVLLPVIGDLEKNALEAGLLKGDKILSINHQKIASFREIRGIVARSQGELILEIERNNRILEKRLTPKIVAVISESNDPNEIIKYKIIGIKPDMQKMGVVSYSVFQAFEKALSRFKEGVVLIVDSLRRLIMGSASVKELSGVIGIVGALSHANSVSTFVVWGVFVYQFRDFKFIAHSSLRWGANARGRF
ncbi:RIP metalloprotease RseP [Helicobacter pylori GAM121Aii]|nr:RIP metalloprotease RseP [Helicobacter pylori GAM121Aii]